MAKNTERQNLCFPVKLSGKTIGHLNLLSDDEKLSNDDYNIVEQNLIALLDAGAITIESFALAGEPDNGSSMADTIAAALNR